MLFIDVVMPNVSDEIADEVVRGPDLEYPEHGSMVEQSFASSIGTTQSRRHSR